MTRDVKAHPRHLAARLRVELVDALVDYDLPDGELALVEPL